MFKMLRKLAATRIVVALIYYFARIYSATFRLKLENEAEWINCWEQGGKVLLCAWHQQFFAGVRLFIKYRKYKPTIMSSKSLDGEIGAGVARMVGCYAVRGSSSRDGGIALKEMIHRLKKYRLAVHMLDGPRGPGGIVKAGVIALAHSADAIIMPVFVTADRAWYLHSWDRFMVPKPFARVTVHFCPKLELPPIKDQDDFEKQRKMLGKILQPYLHL